MDSVLPMFATLVGAFRRLIPQAVYGDGRRLEVLAWAVIGLCQTKTVNFIQWAEVVLSQATRASSHQRRFHRWLHNPHIRPAEFYPYLLQAALADWDWVERLYVAVDVSDLHNGYILIRTALIYRGRAIPVAWRVIAHPGTSIGYAEYEPVLQQTIQALPATAQLVFLLDRGFVHQALFRFIRHQPRCQVRLRAKATTQVRLHDRRVVSMAQLCPPQGQVYCFAQVAVFGDGLIGPVYLALAQPETPGEEPWYIISDQPTGLPTLDEYALRFDIEENFLDDKSNGFQAEASRLDDAAAWERLFSILAVATLYFTSVGTGVVKLKFRRFVDSHWDRGMSYLKIGWSWLRQQYRRGWPSLPTFWLDPEPDPEPALASRRQAAQPKRTWVVSCFGAT